MKYSDTIGPYVKSENDTKSMMIRLLISLTPIICFAIFKSFILGFYYTNVSIMNLLNPLFLIIASIISSLLAEGFYFKIIKKNSFKLLIKNISTSYSIIPGILLALVLPINTPIWIVILGSFTASIIGKMIYGGLGTNIFNPALIGYLIIISMYSSKLGTFFSAYELDSISGATPLTNLTSIGHLGTYATTVAPYGSLLNFLFGTVPGSIGEVSKILIILAFMYLTITKTIKWKISISYVFTVFLITLGISIYFDLGLWFSIFNILSGGLLFGAVFMATDPVTSPTTSYGQTFYGITLGIITVLLRYLTPYPEGVMTSILFMNMFFPLYDRLGLIIKNKFKYLYIFVLFFAFLITATTYYVSNKLDDAKKANASVKITSILKNNNYSIYNVESKGFGIIKTEVKVENNKITSIKILDNSGESRWNYIENSNYIESLVKEQTNIDNFDAIAGCTYTSKGLKNIIKIVLEEVNK